MVRTCRNGFMTFVILGLSLAALSMTVAFSRSASAELGCQAEYLRGAETEYRAEESLFKAYDIVRDSFRHLRKKMKKLRPVSK